MTYDVDIEGGLRTAFERGNNAFTKISDEVEKWIEEENIPITTGRLSIDCLTFCFKNEADAIFCKLTWGLE